MMNHPKRPVRLAILSVLFFLLIACDPVPIPTSDATPTAPLPPTAAEPGFLVIQVTATPPPPRGGAISIGAVGELGSDVNALPAFVQSAIYDSLLRLNPSTGALEPGLAESWDVSTDATTFTFRLRTGVRWHNGDPLIAADVAATLNAFASPDFRGTPITDFGPYVSASALDSRTVRVVLREAYCPALTGIGTLKILPRAIVQHSNFPRLTPDQWIGTGPLKLRASSANQYTLAPNETYYRGAPHIDTWTLRLYPDAAALREALAAGQIDLSAGLGAYTASSRIAGTTPFAKNSPAVVTLLYNTENIALHDVRVRQALTFAVDRNVLLSDLSGQAESVDSSTLPGYWARPADLPRYPFDLNRAKQLLADAGWRDAGGVLQKDGRPLRLQLWTEADDPILEPLAFRLREMYTALGVQVELELDDRPGWVTHAFEHRFDLLLLSRKMPSDPDQRWYWQSDQNAEGSGFNFGSYSSGLVDALLKESLRAAGCEPAKRAALFGEINRSLLTDAPAAFLLTPKEYVLARERVLGAAPSTFAGDFWNLNEWRVK